MSASYQSADNEMFRLRYETVLVRDIVSFWAAGRRRRRRKVIRSGRNSSAAGRAARQVRDQWMAPTTVTQSVRAAVKLLDLWTGTVARWHSVSDTIRLDRNDSLSRCSLAFNGNRSFGRSDIYVVKEQ